MKALAIVFTPGRQNMAQIYMPETRRVKTPTTFTRLQVRSSAEITEERQLIQKFKFHVVLV